ncbi:hypothetical protein TWF706_000560 [Orbilia oligospora]|uniref:Uncharacterized protein n=1 Tax=Orbilia oligospora TaxID=2813651 RepID=A0A7C8JK27_ORBOL|nr:hypothetical protein TWF706_000560 [Orbilia oligospora]KAF3123697.1 hypothetical protein TWF703_000684 [Orbilia oligospora]
MSSIPCTPKGNSRHHAADPHSCTSSLSSGSVTDDWSIGSPVLSITSIDPCSPSLRFQDRPQGSRSGSAPFPTSEVGGDDEEADRATDLRHKASNYLQYIESLSQAYESQLNALSAFFKINEGSLAGSVQDQFESYIDDPAVTIIEICRDRTRHLIGIDDVDMLVDYFCEQEGPGGLMLQKNSGVSVISRVFLLDKITPDIMGVFGAKLGVEPQFWDAHLQLGTAKSMAESSNAAGSSGQLVRYGSESGSKVSFLNIPLLRRYPSSESLDKKEGGRNLPPNQQESEGCSIHLDYNTNDAEPATVLIMVNHGSETTNTSSKALRTSFVEHLMSTSSISVPTPLTHNLIKAILHHLTSTLTSIPQQTQQHTSQFTINLFKDDTDKIRESISSEATVISTLSKTLSNSLLAVDNSSASSSTTAGASGSGVKALDTLAPLLQQFQEQTEQVTQWLKDLDTAVVDSQRQREARLRRLKIVVPVCSISLAIGVVIVFVTRLGVPDGV